MSKVPSLKNVLVKMGYNQTDAENIQKDDKLKEKAEKAEKLFVDKMSNYGIDVEAYERLCQPERDSKKDDDKVDEEPNLSPFMYAIFKLWLFWAVSPCGTDRPQPR